MTRRIVLLAVLAVLAVVALTSVRASGADQRHLVATFPRTTSLYEGANVKVLGVKVGSVESIEVKGTGVEVDIAYDEGVKLPADVHALIVPPSIVGDRFVQLAPAYDGDGPVLADGERLDLTRTGVPLELDDTYRGIDKLAVAMGPEGANRDGDLSRLITAAADSMRGNGRQFNETIRELAGAMSTLAGSSDDISGTVRNLSTVTSTFKGKDRQMRALIATLAAVSAHLNSQRGAIAGSVEELRAALKLVAQFTRDNRGEIKRTVDGLASVTGTLTKRITELEQLSDLAPVGLTSLMNIHVPKNWDPSRPWLTPVAGRTSVQALRGALFDDLDVQLGFAMSAACAGLTPAQRQQLASFCSTLEATGGRLGQLIMQASRRGDLGSLAPIPRGAASRDGGR